MANELIADFYMSNGQTITIGNVENVSMNRDTTTGRYTGYTIDWLDVNKAPKLFTLCVSDIIAVVVREAADKRAL